MIIVAISLLAVAVTYLVIAEREQRVANPDALPWLERVGRSAQRHLCFLLAVVLAHVVHVLRGIGPPDNLSFVILGIVFYVLIALSAATFNSSGGGENA